MIMNHEGTSPMWGVNPDELEAPAATDDELWTPSFDNTSSRNTSDSFNLLTNIDSLNTYGINDPREENKYQPQGWIRSSSSIDDIHRIISREMEQQDFEIICAQENCTTHSTTYVVEKGLLYAMPNKDIPFEVFGAQPGHVVRMGLRYSTGAHHNTPVRACKTHSDDNDKDMSFYVPKHYTRKIQDSGGHFILEVSVSSNSITGNSFKFSLVFRCLNSCYKDYGKAQELVLQLCDGQNNILKERTMPLRICKNLNRDKKQAGEGKKRRGGKTAVPSPKRVKQEPEERDHAIQAGTLPLPSVLSYHGGKLCCEAVVDACHVPLLNLLFKTLGSEVKWKEGHKHDGLPSGPPDAV